MEERYKKVSESRTEQVYIVRARYLNAAGRLFGGSLMAWIDETGAITARRHCSSYHCRSRSSAFCKASAA